MKPLLLALDGPYKPPARPMTPSPGTRPMYPATHFESLLQPAPFPIATRTGPQESDLQTTEKKGAYVSQPLRRGTYRLRCVRGQAAVEHTVQVEAQKTLTLNIVLPPEPPPIDKGKQPAPYKDWLPCKIMNTVPEDRGMLLMIALDRKRPLDVSMEGVVLSADAKAPIAGGGRFEITKIIDGTRAFGLLSSYWPQVKNHACRINARRF